MGGGYAVIRELLFRLDPERAHRLTLGLLRLAGWFPPSRALLRSLYAHPVPVPAKQAMGLTFPNPVGLAAGFDKDGLALAGLACLGFGHIEVGTVTPRPQAGRQRPRIFRLQDDDALINRMGFPNRGVHSLVNRLRRTTRGPLIIGVNLGKGVDTPLGQASDDYVELLKAVHALADYATINLSSPNTPGLRQLQLGRDLHGLLKDVCQARETLAAASGRRLPLALKLSPDLAAADLVAAVDAARAHGVDGIVAVNTTRARHGLASANAAVEGGLSGRPLWPASLDAVARIRAGVGESMAVIGVGGIDTPDRAQHMLDSGADLIQVYTGLIYRGPSLPAAVLRGLSGQPEDRLGPAVERPPKAPSQLPTS